MSPHRNVAKCFLLILAMLLSTAKVLAASPYCGCLLFVDDLRTKEELNDIANFTGSHLVRSWYRWGEPLEEKAYKLRSQIVPDLRRKKVSLGGGTSLSVVSAADLASPQFQQAWLSVDLQGKEILHGNQKYASLSSPEFRKYLIRRLIEQAQTGVTEFHLGESNGEIHFDDWTLGLKGQHGFVQWLHKKYPGKTKSWWKDHLGELGIAIFENKPTRTQFLKLSGTALQNFKNEWGLEGSWHGTNEKKEPAFLASLYKQNLESLLRELKDQLKTHNLSGVVVDVWGFADWMWDLKIKPDAFLSSPPDARWGFDWSTNENFDFAKNRARMVEIMKDQVQSVSPVPVVYMIDHPKPFQDFAKLSDSKQAELLQGFASITKELGANFAFRIQKPDRSLVTEKVFAVTQRECKARLRFCPGTPSRKTE